MKWLLFILISQIFTFCYCVNPISLLNANSRSITMRYLTPLTTDGYNEYMRVQFEMLLTNALAYAESATGICVRTADSTYTIAVGDKAFGISFICTVPSGCSSATSLNVAFYSSTITSISPTTWSSSGIDYSSANVGSYSVGTGTNFTTRYGFSQSQASSSNVPLESETVYLKCFGKYYVSKDSTRLDSSLDISGWEQETKAVTVSKTEYTCEKGVTCSNGAYQHTTYVAIFALFSLLFLLV